MWKCLCLVAIIGASNAQASPTFELDPSGKRVVWITNLYDYFSCDPRSMRGKVVKQNFEQDGMVVSSFVLDLPDGAREVIGVSVDLKNLSENAREWIIRGLQTLLAVGHEVAIVVNFCGFTPGSFLMLNTVREVPPSEN